MKLSQLKRIIRESIREIQLNEDIVDPCATGIPEDVQCETDDDCPEHEPVCRTFGKCKSCDGAYKYAPDSKLYKDKISNPCGPYGGGVRCNENADCTVEGETCEALDGYPDCKWCIPTDFNKFRTTKSNLYKTLEEQQSNLRPGEYTHPLADTAGKSLTFTVTPKGGQPYIVNQNQREYNTIMRHVRGGKGRIKQHISKDTGGTGNIALPVHPDCPCCKWWVPSWGDLIPGLPSIEWLACCAKPWEGC